MAFTRNFLKTMGLSDEQVSAIMEEHTAVTEALKQQRDGYKADADRFKADAEKLPGVQQELDTLKGGEDYKTKYEAEHTAYEAYKAQVARDAEAAKVTAAYRKLLADEKISEKSIDAVLRVTDLTGMKLNDDGTLENADKLREAINTEWADFKTTTRQRGMQVDTPPANDNGGNSMNEIRRMGAERRAARYGAIPTNNQ